MFLQRFSTDNVPDSSRGVELRQRLFALQYPRERVDEEAPTAPPGLPFRASMSAYCGRSLRVAAWEFSRHQLTIQAARSGEPPRMFVTLQLKGSTQFSQDRRSCEIRAGEFCLIDPSRAYRMESTDIEVRTLYLDRKAIAAAIPFVEDLTARAFGFQAGPGAILASIVDETLKAAPGLHEEAADSIADAIPHVLASATAALRSTRGDLDPTGLRALHLQRIRRFVLENIGEQELDTARIAAAVQLSPRYVQELFEEESTPLMRWVWQERLARSRHLLASGAHAHRQIAEIAYACGFSDVAHFSRAFRREFGVSPRDCRAAAQAEFAK